MTASAASTIVDASGYWGIFGPRSRMGLCDYMGSCLRLAGLGLLLLLLTSCEAPTERPEGAVSSPVQVGETPTSAGAPGEGSKPQIAPPAKGSQEAVRAQPHARQDVLAAAGQHATSTPVPRGQDGHSAGTAKQPPAAQEKAPPDSGGHVRSEPTATAGSAVAGPASPVSESSTAVVGASGSPPSAPALAAANLVSTAGRTERTKAETAPPDVSKLVYDDAHLPIAFPDGWVLDRRRDLLDGVTRCLLLSPKRPIFDGYDQSTVQVDVSTKALLVIADSNIDASYPDQGLRVACSVCA
jgi:hypothetical protein